MSRPSPFRIDVRARCFDEDPEHAVIEVVSAAHLEAFPTIEPAELHRARVWAAGVLGRLVTVIATHHDAEAQRHSCRGRLVGEPLGDFPPYPSIDRSCQIGSIGLRRHASDWSEALLVEISVPRKRARAWCGVLTRWLEELAAEDREPERCHPGADVLPLPTRRAGR